MSYEFHPLANLFPLIEGAEFEALKNDIRENGQHEPIIIALAEQPAHHKCYHPEHMDSGEWCDVRCGDGVWHCDTCDHNPAPWEYVILDGRNRYRACVELGVEPWTEEYDGDDPLAYVISINLHRRHLSTSQQAMVRAKAGEFAQGGDRKSEKFKASKDALKALDSAFTVGEASVDRARKVLREGTPELTAAVHQNKIPVTQAAQIASRPPDEQRAIVERVEAGERPVAAVRAVLREKLPDRVAELPPNQYRVIYADPPWKYGDERTSLDGYSDSAAAAQYPTMPLIDICAMKVRDMAAPDSVLFLWATFPLLPDALEVVKAWGFTYKTAFVWDKQRANMGNYHNACAELLIVATRGSCTPEIDTRAPQVIAEPRGKHSAKPESFRALIDTLYPTGPRIELFRRGAAPEGWTVWGNEAAA